MNRVTQNTPKRSHRRRLDVFLLVAAFAFALSGCVREGEVGGVPSNGAAGGADGAGGATMAGEQGAGGDSSAGGEMAMGGDSTAGGAMGTGGAPSAGGAMGAGGEPSAGGAMGAGGESSAGGAMGAGGESSAGGAMGMGGDPASGGEMGTGGTPPSPMPEECNGLDDDLDGAPDEGLVGPPAAVNVGVCADNRQVCQGEAGWQEPDLADTPGYEADETLCDGLDNDCDGVPDEALDMPCGTDEGVCELGVSRCLEGEYQDCANAIGPSAEVCDGLDNDCNGQPDDGVNCNCTNGQVRMCGTDVGACRSGQQTCVNGQWQACEGNVAASVEVCNNIDDDCDGNADDGIAAEQSTCGVGQCAAQGQIVCREGGFVDTCSPGRATPEECDGRDNDCDGDSDEGNPGAGEACNTGIPGICAAGTTSCARGAVLCNQNNAASFSPTCGNQIDEDCDGNADEWRNPCNNCGDALEMGPRGHACRTPYVIRTARARQSTVRREGTIDIPSDVDVYQAHVADDTEQAGEVLTISLTNNTPFGRAGTSFLVQLYRDIDDCVTDTPLRFATISPNMSGVLQFSEGLDFIPGRGGVNDTGDYIIRVTAEEGSDCSRGYELNVGVFQAD